MLVEDKQLMEEEKSDGGGRPEPVSQPKEMGQRGSDTRPARGIFLEGDGGLERTRYM